MLLNQNVNLQLVMIFHYYADILWAANLSNRKKILSKNDIKIYQGNDCQIQSDLSPFKLQSEIQGTNYNLRLLHVCQIQSHQIPTLYATLFTNKPAETICLEKPPTTSLQAYRSASRRASKDNSGTL